MITTNRTPVKGTSCRSATISVCESTMFLMLPKPMG